MGEVIGLIAVDRKREGIGFICSIKWQKMGSIEKEGARLEWLEKIDEKKKQVPATKKRTANKRKYEQS